mmetsp:Transcript_116028/g.323168  ORF Transcript_116028/g.323168 Transcript_116028/m.323168 type:complete len:180 (-) Transcript_116028:200-739(-)
MADDKPELVYFDAAGRAFALRVAMFKAFGKDGWIDKRINFAEFGALKPTLPLGFVPVLKLPGGLEISQTEALTRWAGKKGGLYPANDDQALLCDEVCSTCLEVLNKTPRSPDAAECKRLREEYTQGFLSVALKQLDARAAAGTFILGDGICIADLLLYTLSNMIATGDFDHIPASFLDA